MIVGIGHKKQHGKSTFADMIQKHLLRNGYPCVTDSFAEGLKRVLLELFPKQVQRRHLYGTEKDKTERLLDIKIATLKPGEIVCGRTLMQFFGTEVCRGMYDRIWCVQLANRAAQQPGKLTITSDVRFSNEVDTILSHNGIVVKVQRPGQPSTDEHASERALDNFTDWSYTISNDKNLEELEAQAIQLCEKVIIPQLDVEINNIRRF